MSYYDLPFPKGYKSKFTQKTLKIFAIACGKPPTYTNKDNQDKIIGGKFQQKELSKVF